MRIFNISDIISKIQEHFPKETDAVARLQDLQTKSDEQLAKINDVNSAVYTIAKEQK